MNSEIRENVHCKKGVSSDWLKEHANATGFGRDQVISEYSTRSKDECRMKCENNAADAYNWPLVQRHGCRSYAYNWQIAQSHGCRCYGSLAAENMKMQTSNDWLFCKKSGNS